MTYTADTARAPADVAFRPAGIGMMFGWKCMGCGQNRSTTAGSKGRGVKQRCRQCVEAKKGAA